MTPLDFRFRWSYNNDDDDEDDDEDGRLRPEHSGTSSLVEEEQTSLWSLALLRERVRDQYQRDLGLVRGPGLPRPIR